MRLGIVDHGKRGRDVFWDRMDVAMHQGALDMGVNLTHRSPTRNVGLNVTEIHATMVDEILELCGGGGGGKRGNDGGDDDGDDGGDGNGGGEGEDGPMVDGILVTIPDESMLVPLETCASAGVRIMAFNAGMEYAMRAKIPFLGINETLAGYEAGYALASINATDKYCFVNHSPGTKALTDRWEGMYAGILDAVDTYRIWEAIVDVGDCESWNDVVYDTCRDDVNGTEDWSTVGLYVAGANHDCALDFLRDRAPGAHVVFSDASEYAYDGLRDGTLDVLFVIDQQAYLQGYMPFPFLTLSVTNDQMILIGNDNDVILTGPRLITDPPPPPITTNTSGDDGEGGCTMSGGSTVPDYAVCEDDVASAGNRAPSTPAAASRSTGTVVYDVHLHCIVLIIGCIIVSIISS